MTKTIIHKFKDRIEKSPTKVAMQFKEAGRWVKYYWKDVFTKILVFFTHKIIKILH